MRRRSNIKVKTIPSFAFVVDGETEVWYLQMLKRNEKEIRVNIKPEIPNKKSIADQYKLVCDVANKEFTKVFWIVDMDALIKEDRESKMRGMSALKMFNHFRMIISKRFSHVIILVNNPCLEFWFLLHFERTSKYFNGCSTAEAQLKKHLKLYEKTQKFFTKQNDDIYLKLKPDLVKAIANSMALGRFDIERPEQSICEMAWLFKSEELNHHFA